MNHDTPSDQTQADFVSGANHVTDERELETSPETETFDQLFDQIFKNNVLHVKGNETITPINAATVSQSIDDKNRTAKEPDVQLHSRLLELQTAISEAGGITREIYTQYIDQIGRLAIHFQNPRNEQWNSANILDSLDRTMQICPTSYPEDLPSLGQPEIGLVHKVDGGPGTIDYDVYKKIFPPINLALRWGKEYDYTFEPIYNEEGVLTNLKYYQRVDGNGGDNGIIVREINLDNLTTQVDGFITQHSDEITPHRFDLPSTEDEYRQAISSFNEAYGDVVQIKIRNNEPVAVFPKNPKKMADELSELVQQIDPNIRIEMGTTTYAIIPPIEVEKFIPDVSPDSIDLRPLRLNNTISDGSPDQEDHRTIVLRIDENLEFSRQIIKLLIDNQ